MISSKRAGACSLECFQPSSSFCAKHCHWISLCCYLLSENNDEKDDDALSAMEESSLSESEDDEIISSIRPSKKVIYSSESDMSEKPSDGAYFH